MAWKLDGSYFETCSCEVVCPCTASMANGAHYERCRVTLVFHVADGDVDGTDVSGLTVAALADTPRVMTEGNWRLGVESGEPARLTGIFHPAGSELTISRATRSKISAFGIEYEGKSGFSASELHRAA